MVNVPQFGQPQPGLDYPDRPAAFSIVARGGRIATVRVDSAHGGFRLDLPGGGIDPGETPEQAAVRECGEEAGLRVETDSELVRADHYFVNENGRAMNTRGVFFVARLEAVAPGLKIEDDHNLVWMEPHEALARLSREAHAWALAVWLRSCAEK